MRELARTMQPHANMIGFDFGNELNTCWQAPLDAGDAWMAQDVRADGFGAAGPLQCERRRSPPVV